MKYEYAPLRLLTTKNYQTLEEVKEFMTKRGVRCDNLDIITYTRSLIDKDYISKQSKHNLTTVLFSHYASIFEPNYDQFVNDNVFPIVINEWSKSKQVYKPDKDFANALLNTDEFIINKDIINHLPCQLFYLDLTECNYDNIEGVFVHTFICDNTIRINIFMIAGEEFSPLYIDFPNNDKGTVSIQDSRSNIYNEVIALTLHMISYMSIDKPQITESDLTKNTYRKPSKQSTIRNKWSEVNIQDVGIIYGQKYRKYMKEYNSTENSEIKSYKPRAPHFRKAHYHRFWVGKGRKELRINWIEPIYVGFGDNKNIVINKVEKE